MKKIVVLLFLLFFFVTPIIVLGDGTQGILVISSSLEESNNTYLSSLDDENAIKVLDGDSILNSCIINKMGNSTFSDEFNGANSAVLLHSNSSLSLFGGSITTNGLSSEGIFLKDSSEAFLEDTIITTSQNNSHGIVVFDNGKVEASNLTVTTSGNSSIPVYLNSLESSVSIDGGSYSSNGVGSPVLYSKGDVVLSNAKLTSSVSSGIQLEGNGSLSFDRVELSSNHTKSIIKEKDENYKNIFIYESSSKPLKDSGSTIFMKNSSINTQNGATFYITNTKANISLSDNIIINSRDNIFMNIEASRWGREGENGGDVTLSFNHQSVHGNIEMDSLSTLDFTLKNGSYFEGSINSNNQGEVSLFLTEDSVFLLTEDTYLKSLHDDSKDYSNIYLNGHHLYVDDNLIQANTGTYDEEGIPQYRKISLSSYQYLILISFFGFVLIGIGFFYFRKKKKN